MGLFKEIYCAECGEKTKLLARTSLADGNYLCSKCMSIVPSYMKKTVTDRYTLEAYKDFKEYVEETNKESKDTFRETHSFYDLHIDTVNRMFYIDDHSAKDILYLDFCEIEQFDLTFRPEEYKDGLFGDKVKGKIYIELEVNDPYFYYEDVMATDVKAKAQKSMFGGKVKYDNPEGMDEFLHYFERAWEKDVAAMERYVEEHAAEFEDDTEE